MTEIDNVPARLAPPLPGGGGRSHWVVTPLGVSMVEELAGRGCHVTTIAKALGMSRDGFKACRDRQPEVENAYQRGLASECDALVGNLRRAADEGNIVANIYLLKAKHSMYDQPSPHSATNVQVNLDQTGVLVVPQRQSMEDFLEEQRAAGMLVNAPRPDTVERIPGENAPVSIEARLDPETNRGD